MWIPSSIESILTPVEMAPSPKQILLISELKSGSGGITVRLQDGSCIGLLLPVTLEAAQNDAIVRTLYRWRSAHLFSFLTAFTTSPESMKNYLLSISLPDPARILFLVKDANSALVGNIGLCNVSAVDAELDNVVRGERASPKEIMAHAQRTLLDWAFRVLEISRIYLHVLTDNARAIRAYENVGFSKVRYIPLTRKENADGYKLVPISANSSERQHAELVRMEISKATFL